MHLRFLPNLLTKFLKPKSNPQDNNSGINSVSSTQQSNSLPTGALDLPKFSRVSELNFLMSDDAYAPLTDREERLIGSFRFFSYLILILFSFFAVVGMIFTSKLDALQVEGEDLANKVSAYSSEITAAEQINTRIKYYKHLYEGRNVLGDKSKILFTIPSANAKILNVAVTSSKFTINFEVGNSTDFASIVVRYLKSNVISELSIKSADLDPQRGIYNVILEGVFK